MSEEFKPLIESVLSTDWLRGDLEASIRAYAAQMLVPQHLQEVKARREESIAKTEAAVRDRLTKEINIGISAPRNSKRRNSQGGQMRA